MFSWLLRLSASAAAFLCVIFRDVAAFGSGSGVGGRFTPYVILYLRFLSRAIKSKTCPIAVNRACFIERVYFRHMCFAPGNWSRTMPMSVSTTWSSSSSVSASDACSDDNSDSVDRLSAFSATYLSALLCSSLVLTLDVLPSYPLSTLIVPTTLPRANALRPLVPLSLSVFPTDSTFLLYSASSSAVRQCPYAPREY